MPLQCAYPWAHLLVVVMVGCTSAAPRAPEPSGSVVPRQPKILAISIETEPLNLVTQLGDASGTRGGTQLHLAVHQRLAAYDDRGEIRPMLALDIPSRENGTWVVRGDGTMQTVYRIRPNVTWHDGAPLVAADFGLAWTMSRDREIGTSQRLVADQISSLDTPDDLTLVMEWRNLYPFAHALVQEDLGPLPTHLLGSVYSTDKDRFQQLSYWTREFVGVGPFRLAEWEAGSYLMLRAYDQFYAGPPKIDSLLVKFIENDATVTANLLAGALDGAIPRSLAFPQAWALKQQWEQAGKHPLFISNMTNWRKVFVQFRNPNPPELLDVRARRGLLHAIDRQALVDTLYAGQTTVSHAFVPQNDPRWGWILDVVATYDFDPRRAESLLREAGWRRGLTGTVTNAAGEQVTVPIWASSAGNNALEVAILADNLKALGIAADQIILSGEQAQDRRLLATFPALNPSAISLGFSNTLGRLYGPNCPTEQTRWIGPSIGCYQNPAMDQIITRLTVAIDPAEQRELWRALMSIQTTELPALPLYFELKPTIFREGVIGVRGDTIPSTSVTWNVADWDLS